MVRLQKQEIDGDWTVYALFPDTDGVRHRHAIRNFGRREEDASRYVECWKDKMSVRVAMQLAQQYDAGVRFRVKQFPGDERILCVREGVR